jgi:hypothetical protein
MATTSAGPGKTRENSEASPTDTPKAAFISHASGDADFAKRLCNSLEAKGFPCWLAERDLPPAALWPDMLVRAIEQSSFFLLLASEKAVGSPHVITEVNLAHSCGKQICTVLMPPVTVSREINYYIARWNWLPGGGKTPEEIAAGLAPIFGSQRDWEEVATLAPSLRRTMQYRPAAFARMVAAAAVALILVLATAAFTLFRVLATDYRQIGYVVMSTSADSGPPVRVHPNVWLTAKGVPFQNARLLIANDAGGQSEISLTQWPIPEQVGSSEQLILAIGAQSRRLTTCLTVPNPALGSPWRVTQQFTLRPVDGEVRVTETAEPRAAREDGKPCGAKL